MPALLNRYLFCVNFILSHSWSTWHLRIEFHKSEQDRTAATDKRLIDCNGSLYRSTKNNTSHFERDHFRLFTQNVSGKYRITGLNVLKHWIQTVYFNIYIGYIGHVKKRFKKQFGYIGCAYTNWKCLFFNFKLVLFCYLIFHVLRD